MAGASNSRFERTLALLLRPIAKLMILNNLPLTRAVEMIKRALVQEAQTDDGATDSYISLKSGVHRKDVKRLRAHDVQDNPPATPIAAILSCWSLNPLFCKSKGNPRALARKGNDIEPGFDGLVKAARIDLPPATVLAELLAQGLISENPDGHFVLLSDTYLPKTGDAVLDAFDATILDHLRVATANAFNDETGNKDFDRVLRYSHLSQASIDELEAASRTAALKYLETMNALAHDLQAADDASGATLNGRFVTGVYIAPQAGDAAKNKDKS